MRPPQRDSPLIERLEAAGAVLVGALNMGEYAYDFTGENVHDGPSRNPHDPTRMTGGSSGGSGGAVAGGMVPLALGSDTNGSIRVPSSLCGIFGLKPTYGRLSRARTFPVCREPRSSGAIRALDARSGLELRRHAGATTQKIRLAPGAEIEPATPQLDRGLDGLRIAMASGYFRKGASPEALSALDSVAKVLGAHDGSIFPKRTGRAPRPMSSLLPKAPHCTSIACAASHDDFDPAVRDRLIAGAMLPAPLVVSAQKFRRWYRERMLELFKHCDAILAPATPCTAPKIGQQTFILEGVELPVRPNIGIYTQPISFIGLPVVAVPVPLQPSADRRADHHCAVARGHRLADRPCLRADGNGRGASTRHLKERDMDIDLPEVVAEVRQAFDRYEQALVSNDVAALDAMFHDDTRTIRYGTGENLHGYAAIASFRGARSPVGLARTLSRTVITTFGRDFAVASTLFERTNAPGKIGRQMQTWVRLPKGWRVVAAHVSLIDAAKEASA